MFTDLFASVITEFVRAFAVLGLILALLQCFFGYRMIRFWISLAGFLIGFLIGYGIAVSVVPEQEYTKLITIVIGIAAGALLAALAYKLYLAGLFLYCGLLAVSVIASIHFPEGELWEYLSILFYLLAFFGAGMLAIRFERPLIIVITAVSGASNAVVALAILIAAVGEDSLIYLFVLAGLMGGGMLVQFLTTKGQVRRKKKRS